MIETHEKQYPDLQFVVFESALFNEFLNHQIAQNTIYVQVEIGVRRNYQTDVRKINRYAGRRGKASEVERIVGGL